MKADRIIKSAASVLGAVTFAVSLAVIRPVAAQTSDTASPNIVWVASQPARKGVPAVSLAPDGTTFGSAHAYYAADFYSAYNIGALHAEDITGKGQTIVIVDAYGSPTALEDLRVFSQTFGLPEPDLTIIYPNGKPTLNSPAKLSWALETSLDLQWAHAVAPEAKLVLIAPHPASAECLFKGVSYAVEHYPGSTISQSWAYTEPINWSGGDDQIANKFHPVYQQAVLARCTVLSGSGDYGTANGNAQGVPTVCWPASDPLVTGVGGTWLQYGWRWEPLISATTLAASGDLDSYLNWVDDPGGRTEAVWKEDWLTLFIPYDATGGGLSAFFATPDFQQGLPQSLLQGRRGVPDISCNAAVDGGVLVYYQGSLPGPFPVPAGWVLVGGTSAATPELAGMVALANQLRSQMGKQPIGYLNPVLYTLPTRDFNDVVPQTFGEGPGLTTLDDNSYFGSAVPGFKTTAGYDLTTGLGSPNAYWFVHDLADTP